MKQPALKDVAGMIRSFSYAAYAELVAFAARGRGDLESLDQWSRLWLQSTSSAFLRSYLNSVGDSPILPSDRNVMVNLLKCFLLDKALYELKYELNNRPDWVWIPISGILSLSS
jgi:maltose alpha-D-glucosyltransferase/alpha-amylase